MWFMPKLKVLSVTYKIATKFAKGSPNELKIRRECEINYCNLMNDAGLFVVCIYETIFSRKTFENSKPFVS